MIETIISGGQTGADRAAPDWAIEDGMPHGGWCPKERRAEDGGGSTPKKYLIVTSRYRPPGLPTQ
ncbi:YpsA SLOG family protein [Nitrospira sp. Nam80]